MSPIAISRITSVSLAVALSMPVCAQQPDIAHDDHVLHTFSRQQLTDIYFSEGAAAGDVNGDGAADVVCGPYWFQGPSFETKREIYPAVPQNRKGYANNFFSWIYDFDGNGDNDILTVGFPGTPGYVYRNPGKDQLDNLWEKVEVLDSVSNESPQFTDITGNGIPELVCTRHGHYGYAKFDRKQPLAAWTFVSVSDDVAPKPFGHGLGVGDVNGDGRMDVIARNGWFEQPAEYAANDNWPFYPAEFAPGGADMFAYDVDGDGDNDIITSLNAHTYGLAWYENQPGKDGVPDFEKHLIMGNKTSDNPYGVLFTEPHAVQLADINGDGLQDIVTGKTYWSHHEQSPLWDAGAVVYWFELHREAAAVSENAPNDPTKIIVDFVPHKADGESGIGRGLFVGDINNDNLPDIVTGGMKGAHVLTHVRREVSHEEYELAQPTKRPEMAEGLDPQAAAAHMTVPPGFKVQLAAGEPLVHQPIAMCFDHRGRLWVAEGHTYPLRAADGEGKDRIVIFEDKNGDGVFDHSKTFIEGLNLVSGLEVGFGGVYVGAAPYLMFIPDRDGDDRPDGINPTTANEQATNSAQSASSAETRRATPPPAEAPGDVNSIIANQQATNSAQSASSAETRRATPPPAGAPGNVNFITANQQATNSAQSASSAETRRATPSPAGAPGIRGDVPAGAIVLLDGFGWHDTHETLNGFIWGPDGWLYGCHGVFTHSKVGKPGTPDDQRKGLNAGVWRYHPTKHVFEVFAHGTSNPWGVDFNDHGQCFITACVIPHLWHMVQGGRYHRQGGQHFNSYTYADIKTIADHAHYIGNIRDHAWWGHEPRAAGGTAEAGGGHAHAGAMIYLGDNWPDKYRNQILFNNIHGNRINNDLLERVDGGSGFVGRHGRDFLFANDHYYRGINLRYGPDGSVYIIDWYDKNACHRNNPEIWDRSNGRIFRVSYNPAGQPAIAESVDLSQWKLTQLLAAHEHRNEWYARMARKTLMHRHSGGASAVPKSFVDDVWSAAADVDKSVEYRLRYLWTLNALDGLTEVRAVQLLADRDEYVRAWTIQLTLEDHEASAEYLGQLVSLAGSDKSPVVRLYLASGLQRLPLEQRWSLASTLANHGEDAADHNIPLVLWYSIEPLVPTDAKRAMELALHTKIPLLRSFIVRRASAQNDTIAPVVATLNSTGDDDAIQQLILDEMLAAFEGRVEIPMPKSWQTAYDRLAASDQESLRDKADQLAIIFGDQRVFPRMRNLLADADQNIKRRRQALDVLIRGQDKASAEILLSESVLGNAQLQGAAVRALSILGDDDVPKVLLARYRTFDENVRRDIVSTLVSRPTWTTALLKAIGDKTVPIGDLHAYHVRQVLAFKNDTINELLTKNWGEVRETSADRKQQIEQWKLKLTPATMKTAHLGNGRRVYQKTCQNCHRLFGTGGDIGPEITGSNRANLDYILENVLDPSAVVGRNYQMTTVALDSGRVVSGLLKQETDSALTIQTINDKIVVPKSQIEDRSLSNVSMMPERQLDALSKEDARDLIAYLASPTQVTMSGPPSPIDAKTGKVPNAVEGESMKIVEKTAGMARSQPMSGFSKGRWSGNDQLWWTGGKPGSRLALELPVDAEGTYVAELVLTKARDYAVVRVSIDDQVLDASLDLYNNPDVITTGVLSFPGVTLKQGNHRLQFEITGAHPDAVRNYMLGIDYARLVPAAE